MEQVFDSRATRRASRQTDGDQEQRR